MIKYIVTTNSKLIKFNTETQDVELQDNQSFRIYWLWVVKEDGIVNNQEVNTGDIILLMYPIDPTAVSDHYREVFVIKDEKLKDYYKRYIEFHEFQNAEHLKRCDECENCCCSDPS